MYLGVDGGGTKTALCLLTPDGRVAARTQVAGMYYFTSDISLVDRVLAEGTALVCKQAGITPQDVRHAFFGMPGYGEASGDTPVLDAAPRAALGHDRYRCDNDMVCGWAGSLGATDGINILSGTGSMTYGERAGLGVRVGGWSELFGDEGSAYWIAVRGLAAFSRMSDGRQPEGPLLDVLRSHLGIATDLDLIDVVANRWHGERSKVADLCRQVVEAADLGDEAATAIVDDAARELALHVDVTRRRLGFARDETVPVSWSGGTFAAPRVIEGFTRELGALHAGYALRRPLLPPDVGAAMYAARLSGTPLDAAAFARLCAAPVPAFTIATA